MTETKVKSSFELSLPIVAAALGNQCGVGIEIGGDAAFTNGKTICLPFFSVAGESEEREVLGLLCHECGHVRFTEMSVLSKANSAFERALDNALEDVRIEAEMSKLYIGAETLFREAHERIVSELVSMKLKPRDLIPFYALIHAESNVLKRDWLKPYESQMREKVVSAFGKVFTRKLEEFARLVGDAQSTRDCQGIRKKILKLMQSMVEKGVKNESEKKAESFTQLPSGRENGEAVDNSNLKMPFPDNGTSDANFGEKSSKSMASGEPRKHSSSSSDGISDSEKNRLAKVLETLDSKLETRWSLSDKFVKMTNATEEKIGTVSLTGIRPACRDPILGAERIALARLDSSKLRHALLGLVQTQTNKARRLRDHGRRIDSRKLARLATANPRVFVASQSCRRPDTVIHVLLDLSGSMGVDKSELALRASLGLVEGLQTIRGVSSALSVFPGVACGQRGTALCSVVKHGEKLSNLEPGTIGVLDSYGSTPLTEAILGAGIDLLGRKEPKKVIVVVTDGPVPPERCFALVKRLKEDGIHFIGIQIDDEGDNPLSALIPASSVVTDMDTFKQSLFALAKTIVAR